MSPEEYGVQEPYGSPAEAGASTATQAPPPPPPVPPTTTAAGTPAPEPHRRERAAGVRFAMVLIFVGVLLLVAQLVPGLSWWSLWPLIIIAAGVVQAVTPGREGWNAYRLFDGLVTVAFGLVFLAITLGVVGWSIWWTILGLWPVLIIAIGFDLLGKSLKSSWLRVIGSIAIMGALAYAVAVHAGELRDIRFAGGAGSQRVSVSEPVRGAELGTLRLSAGVAELTLRSGDELITAEGTSPFGEPRIDVERDGDRADVRARFDDGDATVVWPGGAEAELDVTLSDEVLWDAEIETGMSTLEADLSDLQIASLALKPGIADCEVRLPDAPDIGEEGRVSVKAGISDVELRVPADAEVRVQSSSGLSSVNVDRSLESLGGGVWETPGFSEAREAGDPVWLITVESGIGSFSLKTY